MIHKENNVVIECDKCHTTSSAQREDYNDIFLKEGWSFKRTRKGVTHICFNCKTPKQKKATAFVRTKFAGSSYPNPYN